MANTKYTFKRYEKKYLLTPEQYAALTSELKKYMRPDKFPSSTVCSLYYDTQDFSLIRESLEKPMYKEKLRVRSYGVPGSEDKVFVEIKKKYDGIVYKRRVSMPEYQAVNYLDHGIRQAENDSQIFREIDWLCRSMELTPKVLISCDRLAVCGIEDPELRMTFDSSVRWRDSELDLTRGDYGQELLPDEKILMEAKIAGAAPLWLAGLLSRLEIYPTSFSKYGSCYTQMLTEKTWIGVTNCA